MLEFNIFVRSYIQDGDLVIELEDQDGFFISGCNLPLADLKEALESLDAPKSQSKS